MSEELSKKKRIRAGHRASATRTVRKVNELVDGGTADKLRLSLLRLALKEKLETLKALDSEVAELVDDDALAEEIENADGYRETVFDALIKIDTALGATTLTGSTPPREHSPTIPAESRASRVKLPKLQLRPFNGDLTKWTSFWEFFESAVHNNTDLSDIEKFNYLTSLLERSARKAISGLVLTAANYHKAIAILKGRFGSKEQIVNKHMDALLHLEGVTLSQNTRALRRLFDNVSSHIRSLKSLGLEPETYGSLLCPVLVAKLPADLRLIVSRKVSEEDWNLEPLMTAVEEEIIARERQAVQNRHSSRRSNDKVPPTATTLVSGNARRVIDTPSCCYCSQPHTATNCDVVIEVDACRESLRRSGRCFSCLRKGHLSRACRSTNRCRTCNGRHHTSICTASSEQRPDPTQQPQGRLSQGGSNSQHRNPTLRQSSQPLAPTLNAQPAAGGGAGNPASSLNPGAPPFASPATHASTLYVDSGKAILLQTAMAEASNPLNPTFTVKLRVVMDTGSQRYYLTQHVKDALALSPTQRQRLSIATFGSARGELQECDIVCVAIRTKCGNSQQVNLLVVPHICDPLTAQPVSVCAEMYSHLSHLDLAEASQGDPLEVDMLIGSDYYWDFITGETVRGRCGPVAINTTLGWVLSGPVEMSRGQRSSVSLIHVSTHTLRVDGVSDQSLDTTLRSFWELESLGIQPSSNFASDHFASTVEMKNGRYEVALPWCEYHEPLPDNYDLSHRRLGSLLRRLRQDPAVMREYDTIIREQLSKGIVEEVNPSSEPQGVVHYLPHHPVIRRTRIPRRLEWSTMPLLESMALH